MPFVDAESAITVVPEMLTQGDRSAGHTHRSRRAAWNMSLRKGGAVLDEPIHVRCKNVRVAKRADRIVALVIGKEKNDVRRVRQRAPSH